MLGSICGQRGCDGGLHNTNRGAGTGCGEQTRSSCSETPEAKDQGQKCKHTEMWKSLLYPDTDCAALQGALGLGMGAGAWAPSVVLLLTWGKLLPPPDLGSPIPRHPGWWHKPVPAQKYRDGWKCRVGLMWSKATCHHQESPTATAISP